MMGDRKAPTPPPGSVKPEPPQAPPMRIGRIEQLAVKLKSAGPFESKRLAEELANEVDRRRRNLTEEERQHCRESAWRGDDPELHVDPSPLLRIIERLTGERFLEGE